MTTRRFLTTVLVAVPALAIALALAEILDAPWLRLVAVALLLVILIARVAWSLWLDRSWWLAFYGTVLAVGVLAFVARQLVG